MQNYFRFDSFNTSYKQEIIAGITTFVTMSYIIIVNPAILEAAGIPKGPTMVATIISAFFGTIVMGLYANRPFAIAPYMGENAFIAFTVVKGLGYSWQTAIGAIFIGGVLFTLLTIFRIRSWLAQAIPESLKHSFAVGIGLFLTFIGLNETGIITIGTPGAPVQIGTFSDPTVLLAMLGFLVIGFLLLKRVNGAILIGILAITFLSYIFRLNPLPEQWISMPPDIRPILFKLDIAGAFTWGFISVIITVFVMDFVDTMGTLIGVSARAGLLDEDGNLPEIEKPMLADALTTVLGSLLGTTTSGTYIESAAGIESGGKTGFTSVVTAFLFLLALFLAPFLTSVPAYAYGPALIVVGMMMIAPVKNLNFSDYSELIPAFATIILMSFTFNIGIGMTAGFILYVLFQILTGKIKTIHFGMWILSILSLLFYLFYPYHS
ncbi:NCS2 family permease [candidate division KSB1 bacterium]|nr:NCS2 family permease [candidate division KSB1 bacterium]